MRSAALLALAMALSLGLPVLAAPWVHRDSSTFRDKTNRTRLWHGTNFVNKAAPFYPPELVGDQANATVSALQSMGLNVVRLGVMVGGTFPSASGELNTTYLDQIERIVDMLSAQDIPVLLDLHQDVLSPTICGEGLPAWMVNSSDLGSLDFPLPLIRNGSEPDPATGGWYPPVSCAPVGPLAGIGWSEWYGTDACGKAFDQVYKGTGTPGEYVQRHWAAVAERFNGHAGVLAFEMLNEPWNGDWVSDPALLVRGGVAETDAVGPFMEMTHNTIRTHDKTTPTLYAPAELNNRLMRSVGYDEGFLPGEPMAFHVYCLTGTDGDGPVTPGQVKLCHFNDGFQLTQREKDLRRLKTAGFVTEFGAVSDTTTGLAEVRYVQEAMDATSPPLSWAFWDGVPAADEEDYRATLARAYPRAVAGDLGFFSFNSTTAAFELTFVAGGELGATGTTDVFLGAYAYPHGWVATVEPADCCTVTEDPDTGMLHITATDDSAAAETTVTLRVVPREAP